MSVWQRLLKKEKFIFLEFGEAVQDSMRAFYGGDCVDGEVSGGDCRLEGNEGVSRFVGRRPRVEWKLKAAKD